MNMEVVARIELRETNQYTQSDKQDVEFCYSILVDGAGNIKESVENLKKAYRRASREDQVKLGNVYAAILWITLDKDDKLKLIDWILAYEEALKTGHSHNHRRDISIRGGPEGLSNKQCKLFLGYMFTLRFEVNVKICRFIYWKQSYPQDYERLLEQKTQVS